MATGKDTGKDQKFRIGLAQFACSLNPDENLAKALEASVKQRTKARRSSACRSCSDRSISAAKRMPSCSIWPNRFPALPRKRSARSRVN